jgi:hypothetical protein
LFDALEKDEARQLARQSDPETSHEAAVIVAPKLSALKQVLIEVLTTLGPSTMGEVEQYLIDRGETTKRVESIRKRKIALVREGLIEVCSTRACTVSGVRCEVVRVKQ